MLFFLLESVMLGLWIFLQIHGEKWILKSRYSNIRYSSTPRKQFLWIKEIFCWYRVKENFVFVFESTKLWIKEIFSLTAYQRNIFFIRRNCSMGVDEYLIFEYLLFNIHFFSPLIWRKIHKPSRKKISFYWRNFCWFKNKNKTFINSKKLFYWPYIKEMFFFIQRNCFMGVDEYLIFEYLFFNTHFSPWIRRKIHKPSMTCSSWKKIYFYWRNFCWFKNKNKTFFNLNKLFLWAYIKEIFLWFKETVFWVWYPCSTPERFISKVYLKFS